MSLKFGFQFGESVSQAHVADFFMTCSYNDTLFFLQNDLFVQRSASCDGK